MNGWMSGWVGGWKKGVWDRQTNGQTRWMNGWMELLIFNYKFELIFTHQHESIKVNH